MTLLAARTFAVDAAGPHTQAATPRTGRTVHSYFLLDRTGSMSSMANAVKQGFRKYVREQQEQPEPMLLSVAQFDSTNPFEVLIEGKDIHAVSDELTGYSPRDRTPLYDAIEKMIDHAERTSHGAADVIVVVFTDGAENASTKATRQSVLAKIEACKQRGWTFVFLGANIDSFEEGGALGISRGSTTNYAASAAGMDYGWGTVSKAMLNQRNVRARPNFTQRERLAEAASFFDSSFSME